MKTSQIKTCGMWTMRYLKENVYPYKFIRTERKLLKNKLNIQLKKHKNKISIKKTRRKGLKKYKCRN